MTKKLFWRDPYQVRLETVVAAVDDDWVTLSETIIYAFSGGQESDRGTIAGYEVLEARKEGSKILYRLPQGHGVKIGEEVTVCIDWTRRYRLMRLHFAAELVLELVCELLDCPLKVGAHIAEDKARIDFAWEGSIAELFPAIESRLNRIISSDTPILSEYSDMVKEQRYWEVPGFARVPCGGTHLRRTGEVGAVRLKRKNPGKGKERIEIHLYDSDAA